MGTKALVLWLSGMSRAGKTSISKNAESNFKTLGLMPLTLDGDEVRRNLHQSLTFSKVDIIENNRLIAHYCLDKLNEFDIILVPIISPFEENREFARKIIGSTFFETFIRASKPKLIQRYTKGLYKKFLIGEMNDLIGMAKSHPYEEALNPDLTINTDHENEEESARLLIQKTLHWLDISNFSR